MAVGRLLKLIRQILSKIVGLQRKIDQADLEDLFFPEFNLNRCNVASWKPDPLIKNIIQNVNLDVKWEHVAILCGLLFSTINANSSIQQYETNETKRQFQCRSVVSFVTSFALQYKNFYGKNLEEEEFVKLTKLNLDEVRNNVELKVEQEQQKQSGKKCPDEVENGKNLKEEEFAKLTKLNLDEVRNNVELKVEQEQQKQSQWNEESQSSKKCSDEVENVKKVNMDETKIIKNLCQNRQEEFREIENDRQNQSSNPDETLRQEETLNISRQQILSGEEEINENRNFEKKEEELKQINRDCDESQNVLNQNCPEAEQGQENQKQENQNNTDFFHRQDERSETQTQQLFNAETDDDNLSYEKCETSQQQKNVTSSLSSDQTNYVESSDKCCVRVKKDKKVEERQQNYTQQEVQRAVKKLLKIESNDSDDDHQLCKDNEDQLERNEIQKGDKEGVNDDDKFLQKGESNSVQRNQIFKKDNGMFSSQKGQEEEKDKKVENEESLKTNYDENFVIGSLSQYEEEENVRRFRNDENQKANTNFYQKVPSSKESLKSQSDVSNFRNNPEDTQDVSATKVKSVQEIQQINEDVVSIRKGQESESSQSDEKIDEPKSQGNLRNEQSPAPDESFEKCNSIVSATSSLVDNDKNNYSQQKQSNTQSPLKSSQSFVCDSSAKQQPQENVNVTASMADLKKTYGNRITTNELFEEDAVVVDKPTEQKQQRALEDLQNKKYAMMREFVRCFAAIVSVVNGGSDANLGMKVLDELVYEGWMDRAQLKSLGFGMQDNYLRDLVSVKHRGMAEFR